LGGRGRRIPEFEASLVYRVSSRTARATQRNPVLKNKNKQTKQTLKDGDRRTKQVKNRGEKGDIITDTGNIFGGLFV
jgi:stress response protein YsnF